MNSLKEQVMQILNAKKGLKNLELNSEETQIILQYYYSIYPNSRKPCRNRLLEFILNIMNNGKKNICDENKKTKRL